MHWIYLIHEFYNLSWITEINENFLDILIYWDAPVYMHYIAKSIESHPSNERFDYFSNLHEYKS